MEKITKNDLWLKVLLGLIVTLLVAGFSYLETRKLDKAVFELQRENVTRQLDRIERGVEKITPGP